MINIVQKHGLTLLIVFAVVLGVAGVFLRPEYGPDSPVGFYPMVGVLAVVVAVSVTRLLAPLLKRPEDEYDAD